MYLKQCLHCGCIIKHFLVFSDNRYVSDVHSVRSQLQLRQRGGWRAGWLFVSRTLVCTLPWTAYDWVRSFTLIFPGTTKRITATMRIWAGKCGEVAPNVSPLWCRRGPNCSATSTLAYLPSLSRGSRSASEACVWISLTLTRASCARPAPANTPSCLTTRWKT